MGKHMEKQDKSYSGLHGSNKVSLDEGMYYEIEYDATPMPGVGKFVLKTQKIAEPQKDEVRELFNRMRDIARNSRLPVYNSSKFYQDKVRHDNSEIFYKQGMFMKDFEDDYENTVPYKQYFPYYQLMGYQQLRTYFTWRTQVRRGKVEETSLSYAYLYLYELLNNIGVSDPQDGLDKLLFFRKEFRIFEPSIDKYVIRWLKDYHIYYDLSRPFQEFIREKELTEYYPELADPEDRFDLFCNLSKYDIRKSRFFTRDRESMIRDCFDYTIDKLTTIFSDHGIELESLIFFPTKSLTRWNPFRDALFFPWMQQRDRKVVFSPTESYVCSQNQWFYQTAITTESGKQLNGYILKQMESVLREEVRFKYKITAGLSVLHPTLIMKLEGAGISLEQSITGAVKEFYREATKTIVTVEQSALAKIRREALETQEKLLVPEDAPEMMSISAIVTEQSVESATQSAPAAVASQIPAVTSPLASDSEPSEQTNPWKDLSLALTQTERQALLLTLGGDADIRQFADDNGVMLEVLADGINVKAVDTVGDSLLDDVFSIYDDYLEQVREMLEMRKL